jgi:DNA-binding transcriptional LysR family regulator
MQIETQLSMAVGNMVANGAGVSIIDKITASSLRDKGLLEIRPFLPEIRYSLQVILPSHKPLSRLGESFLDIVNDRLKKAGWQQKTDLQ